MSAKNRSKQANQSKHPAATGHQKKQPTGGSLRAGASAFCAEVPSMLHMVFDKYDELEARRSHR